MIVVSASDLARVFAAAYAAERATGDHPGGAAMTATGAMRAFIEGIEDAVGEVPHVGDEVNLSGDPFLPRARV